MDIFVSGIETMDTKMDVGETAASSSNSMDNDTKQAPSTTPKPKVGAKGPLCLIVLGMAGSGKTTFVQVILFLKIFNWCS